MCGVDSSNERSLPFPVSQQASGWPWWANANEKVPEAWLIVALVEHSEACTTGWRGGALSDSV